jgi:hypothetical protein
MKCPVCATRMRAGQSECPDCGSLLAVGEDSSLETERAEARRPSQVALATKLLAGSLAFSTLKLFDRWPGAAGFEFIASNRAVWVRPTMLALWAVLIVLTWKGNSWARTMIIVAIGWDVLQTIGAASLFFAMGADGLLLLLSWGNIAVELFAVYLLLQSESLDWFRRRVVTPPRQ